MARYRDDTYTCINVVAVKRDTGKAFLFVLENGEEVWFPHSTIEPPFHIDVGDKDVEVSVKDSFLKYKDIRL